MVLAGSVFDLAQVLSSVKILKDGEEVFVLNLPANTLEADGRNVPRVGSNNGTAVRIHSRA